MAHVLQWHSIAINFCMLLKQAIDATLNRHPVKLALQIWNEVITFYDASFLFRVNAVFDSRPLCLDVKRMEENAFFGTDDKKRRRLSFPNLLLLRRMIYKRHHLHRKAGQAFVFAMETF